VKKKTQNLLLIIISVIALLIIAAGVFFFKLKSETGKMAALPTGLVVEKVYAVNNTFVNMYLIRGDSGYIAIDGGNKPDQVSEELVKLSIKPREIKAIFLTHSDGDHVASIPLFGHAVIYLSKDEEQLVNGTTKRFAAHGNKLESEHRLVAPGEILSVDGLQIQCIAAPGHTPGSKCYLVDGRFLFTGDAMSLKDGKADLFVEAFNMDSAMQEESIRKLAAQVSFEYLFTAHYGYARNSKKLFSDFQ
jgi:hydroxyacylglutathione hydrolase